MIELSANQGGGMLLRSHRAGAEHRAARVLDRDEKAIDAVAVGRVDHRHMPDTVGIVEKVAVVARTLDMVQLLLERDDGREVGCGGVANTLAPADLADWEAFRGHLQEHVLKHHAWHEAGACVERKGIEVESARHQPGRRAGGIGPIRDVREQPAGDAFAEVRGVDVHDPQRHVGRPGMVETGACQLARGFVYCNNAAARVERFIHVAKQQRGVGVASEDRRAAVRLIPGVGRAADQGRHLVPVARRHRSH